MKVLILGHKGMLGHMVHKFFLKNTNLEIETCEYRWPSESFKKMIEKFDGNFIINCIGAIHQRTNNFEVNWELPEFLDKNSKCNIIHPGTDCEMDCDDYGISKKRAKDFIVNEGTRTKSLKTSIIGPEVSTKASLMEWFLSQPDNSNVNGFSRYFWDGNTTLTWAKICFEMITNWKLFGKETIVSSECISKYEILESLSEVFEKKITINKYDQPHINKCLEGRYRTPHIKDQLIELKKFLEI